jgi:hypothetical protein
MTDSAITKQQQAPLAALDPMQMIQAAYQSAIEHGAGLDVVNSIAAQAREERDPDVERDRQMDDALTKTPSTPEQIAARRAFVERHFANFPNFQQRLAMLGTEEK